MPPLVLVLARDEALGAELAAHLGARTRIQVCRDTAAADAVLLRQAVDVLLCQDDMPGETGIMFLARHAADNLWTQRILICAPLEPELFVQVINEARVLHCLVSPYPPAALHRLLDRALDEAAKARARHEAARAADRPQRLIAAWLRVLPRLAALTLITCGGVLGAGVATLLLLYLLKTLAGIDLFSDAHLYNLWR